MVFFCDLSCENVNSTHKFECGTPFHKIKDLDVKCAIQIVLEAMDIFGDFDDLRDFVHKAIENRVGIPSASDKRSLKFDCILKLQPKEFPTEQEVNEAREIASNAYKQIVTFPEVNKYFRLDKRNGRHFLEHFLAHNLSVIYENSFRINLTANKGECERILIYDILSMFNHSCAPNMLNYVCGNKMVCITNQQIQRGEQLYISYRPFNYESKIERQKELNNWNFECHCDRCEYPRDIHPNEIQRAKRLNKRQIESQLNKAEEWTPQICAYILRYYELLGFYY
ncbi:SET and MYND domain-containing protein DDB_G0273589-like [Sitodiplosis mosellana]|uniref:SET and MYND domain-containing protein DDB_G0273589-like n=1 Tax=Sitodiplosis mosellana TaxID=263140 RepID=UPI002444C8F0|nr:SET and MYND domain-containing protein DDB_G0273589-like [Sitodiplosis mosellana]